MSRTEDVVLSKLDRLTAMAERMLPQMRIRTGEKAGLFCHRLVRTPAGTLEQIGESPRYTAIALIGVAEYLGADALKEEPWRSAVERLNDSIESLSLGDLGLMLWLDEHVKRWTDRVYSRLTREWPGSHKYADTMERAWILKGLSANTRQPWSGAGAFAAKVLDSVLSAFDFKSGLFVVNPDAPQRGDRSFQRILGSFASQVYPLVALPAYCERMRNGNRSEILDVVAAAAGTMCDLQGDHGEWWWIFDVRSRSVFMDYPVYSVHQDAMGPMALLAAGRALNTTKYLPCIQRGLDYLFASSNVANEPFLDEELGMVWRAIIKDTPGEDVADLPYGLGSEEMLWVRTAGALPWGRRGRRLTSVHFRMLKEARPYCPGWIYYAAALAR